MMSQELLAAKSRELHNVVDELVEIVADAVNNQTPIHEVESRAHATLLRAGQTTLQLLVDCLGDGGNLVDYVGLDSMAVASVETPQ